MDIHMKKSKKTYDKKALNYDNTFDGKITNKMRKELIENMNISHGNKVLDVACGNGRLLKDISLDYGIVGYGIDLSPKMIKESKKRNPGMKFQISSCDDMRFGNEKFDVITVSAAFHHFPDVDKFAREANRILKSGGTIYIAEMYINEFLRKIVNLFVPYSRSGDVKIYSPNEIEEIFIKAGFYKKSVHIDSYVQVLCFVKR